MRYLLALVLVGCAPSFGRPTVLDGPAIGCVDGDEVRTDASVMCGTEIRLTSDSCTPPAATISDGRVVCADGSTPFCGRRPTPGDPLRTGFCSVDGSDVNECARLGGDCVRSWDPTSGELGPIVAR